MIRSLLSVLVLLVGVSNAAAQIPILPTPYEDVPDVGWVGLGGSVGLRFPTEHFTARMGDVVIEDEAYQTAWIVAGYADVYLSRRVALRPGIVWAEPEKGERRADLEGRRESIRQVGFLLDVVVNGRAGRWQPYARAGVGLHLFQQKLPDRVVVVDDEVHFGGSLGGGVEYFLRPTMAITGEGVYQIIERGRLPQVPSAFVVLVGVKQYF